MILSEKIVPVILCSFQTAFSNQLDPIFQNEFFFFYSIKSEKKATKANYL